MINKLKQHKILNILLKEFNDKSYDGQCRDDNAKALSSENLHRKTGYKLDTVNLIVSSLFDDGYIDRVTFHGQGDVLFWSITKKGKTAILNNTFVWFYQIDNILKIFTLLIAVIGLLNSIYHFIDK